MRYYTENSSILIRGSFRIASTGICGGVRSVPALLSHSILPGDVAEDPDKVLSRVAAMAGLGMDYSGFLTPIMVGQICILQYDFITVFISAGILREPPAGPGGITIIVTSSEGLDDAALIEAVMTVAEAKAEALQLLDLPLSGTPSDGIIIASEGDTRHLKAGRETPAGERIRMAVLNGLPEALKRHEAGTKQDQPAFFIFSSLKGGHWIEWVPEKCPYYPCHFPNQSCDFCYCPFYPCKDENLGQWVRSSKGGMIWNCAACTLLHTPEIADYLKKNPGAALSELKLRFPGKKD